MIGLWQMPVLTSRLFVEKGDPLQNTQPEQRDNLFRRALENEWWPLAQEQTASGTTYAVS